MRVLLAFTVLIAALAGCSESPTGPENDVSASSDTQVLLDTTASVDTGVASDTGFPEDTSEPDDVEPADVKLPSDSSSPEDTTAPQDTKIPQDTGESDTFVGEDTNPACDPMCPEHSSCSPEGVCVCDSGFEWVDNACADIDECLTDNGGCGNPAEVSCENQVGAAPVCTPICGSALPGVSSCDIRLGLQGAYATGDYSTFGIKTDAVFVHGYALGSPSTNKNNPDPKAAKAATYQAFWEADEASLTASLNAYCANKLGGACDADGMGCCAQLTGMVVIDLEHPYHPARLDGFDEDEKELGLPVHSLEQLVEAFQLRIKVTQAQMPLAKVGLYGIFVATGQAKLEPIEAHVNKLKEAVTLGLLDGLDFVVPVIYPRFGPTDPAYGQDHAIQYTDFTLEVSADVLSGLANPPAIAPALAFKIFNGVSKHKNEPAPAEYLSWQMATVLANESVDTILFWAGKEDTVPGGVANTFAGLSPALAPCFCGDLTPKAELDDFSCEWEPHPLVAYTWDDPQPGFGASNLLTTYTASFFAMGGVDPLDPEAAAAKLATMPKGKKAILWRAWSVEKYPAQHPADMCWEAGSDPDDPVLTDWPGIWWTEGVAEGKAKVAAFYQGLKELGSDVDIVLADLEWNLSMWALGHCHQDAANAARFDAIEADPRYLAEEIPSLLAPDGEALAPGWLSANVCHWLDGGLAYQVWNQAMKARAEGYVNEMLYEPAAASYAKVEMSNYNTTYFSKPIHHVPALNGHPHCDCDIPSQIVGTHQSREIYGRINQLAGQSLDGKKPYGSTPFSSFKLSVNQAKSVVLAQKFVPFHLWVGPWSWTDPHDKTNGDGTVTTHHYSKMGKTDYWYESVLHAALTAPDNFIFWNNQAEKDPEDHTRLSKAMSEAEILMGCAYRSPRIFQLSDWGQDFVLSAARVEGRRVWRFTPRLEPGQKAADFLTQENPPTFTFESEGKAVTLSFPEGMVYTPSQPVSSYGVWIVQWSSAPLPVFSDK